MKKVDYSLYLEMSPSEIKQLQKTKGWALSLIGLIVYGVLILFKKKVKDYNGICPYFEIGTGWGGVEFGWFFICAKDCSEKTKMHEVGHSIENAAIGGVKMLGLSICSAIRYWWRRLFGANTPYDSWWFEGDATYLGTQYVKKITNKE